MKSAIPDLCGVTVPVTMLISLYDSESVNKHLRGKTFLSVIFYLTNIAMPLQWPASETVVKPKWPGQSAARCPSTAHPGLAFGSQDDPLDHLHCALGSVGYYIVSCWRPAELHQPCMKAP
jgi:hypothetical protein